MAFEHDNKSQWQNQKKKNCYSYKTDYTILWKVNIVFMFYLHN